MDEAAGWDMDDSSENSLVDAGDPKADNKPSQVNADLIEDLGQLEIGVDAETSRCLTGTLIDFD